MAEVEIPLPPSGDSFHNLGRGSGSGCAASSHAAIPAASSLSASPAEELPAKRSRRRRTPSPKGGEKDGRNGHAGSRGSPRRSAKQKRAGSRALHSSDGAGSSPRRGSPRGSPTSSGNTSGGSLRSSGSFGPALPAEARPAEVKALVSKDMRAFARDGCPRLSEIVGREAEVWSGRRWITVRVNVAPTPTEFYRVKLDDGTCLVCTGDHAWAVIADGRIVPIFTRDLRTDLAVSPFLLPALSEVKGTRVPQAYQMGEALGRKMADNYKLKDGLPARVFTMDPESLGMFVAGWMDAQKGTIFGCYEAIHDLQIALHRIGVYHTHVEDLGTYYALGLSQEDAAVIPNPKNAPREYRRTVCALPRVVEVYSLGGGRKKAYTIESDDPQARTVVLDGVLTLC